MIISYTPVRRWDSGKILSWWPAQPGMPLHNSAPSKSVKMSQESSCTSETLVKAAKKNKSEMKDVVWPSPLLSSKTDHTTYSGQNPLLASPLTVGGVIRWGLHVVPSGSPAGCTYTPLPNATSMRRCSKQLPLAGTRPTALHESAAVPSSPLYISKTAVFPVIEKATDQLELFTCSSF